MAPIRLRRVPGTLPQLRELHSKTMPSDKFPQWSLGAWWVAEDRHGRAVAFAGLQPSIRWSNTMYLVRAGVLPEFRGRGLQKRLLLARERYARSVGAEWLITSTYLNTASANSLIARGFRLYEPEIPWGADGTLYWRKELLRG